MKMYTISGAKKWSEVFDLFSHAVNDGKYHKLNYDTFRKLAKYKPSSVINIGRKNDGIITIVDPAVGTGSGYMLWSGSEIDNSLGSFLYDKYFKENENMNNNAPREYDIWGNYSNCTPVSELAAQATSVAEAIHNIADSYGLNCNLQMTDGTWTIAADKLNTGTPIGWNDSISTNQSVSSWCSYPTPEEEFKMLQKRVEELGKLCTDVQSNLDRVEDGVRYDLDKIVDELVATNEMKADVSDVCSLSKRINDALSVADEASYDVNQALRNIEDNAADINALGDEVWNLRLMIEELQKQLKKRITIAPDAITMQSTSSNAYPVKNYKINVKADYMDGDNRKDKENMDTNKMFTGFDFGPVDERVKMSPYGMAIRNADGRYVSYDAKTGQIVDVEVFNFDNHNMIFKMPVAVSAISVGDTVIHMKKPMFVTSVANGVSVIDIFNGEIKTIMPTTNMFGFNFITKVVSLFNFTGANAPTAENPFGNILPFMLMNDNMNNDDMFMMMALMGGCGSNFMNNPLMMYAMLGKDGDKSNLPLMLMAMNGGFNAPATHCNCEQHTNHTQCDGNCHP